MGHDCGWEWNYRVGKRFSCVPGGLLRAGSSVGPELPRRGWEGEFTTLAATQLIMGLASRETLLLPFFFSKIKPPRTHIFEMTLKSCGQGSNFSNWNWIWLSAKYTNWNSCLFGNETWAEIRRGSARMSTCTASKDCLALLFVGVGGCSHDHVFPSSFAHLCESVAAGGYWAVHHHVNFWNIYLCNYWVLSTNCTVDCFDNTLVVSFFFHFLVPNM